MITRRWALPAAASAAALLGAIAPPVAAEEVFTRQAAAANATASTWISAPPRPAAVCIVDTGNDPGPDTSNVIARLAVDGSGDNGGDVSPTKHGTRMSMIAAAPYNGFGMVGIAPSINVVSVRAMRPEGYMPFGDVIAGINLCVTKHDVLNVRVVLLALGVPTEASPDALTSALTTAAIDRAISRGVSVVAAAGNGGGAPDFPATYAPVVAVGAGDPTGARCDFAAFGPAVDLVASGCPVDVAMPDGRAALASGSSEAAALVAGALTQLRGAAPALTAVDAEAALMRASMRPARLDVAGAFAWAGLGGHLDEGRRRTPGGGTGGAAPLAAEPLPDAALRPAEGAQGRVPGPPPIVKGRLPRPRVRTVGVRGGSLHVVVGNRPPGAQLVVRLRSRRPDASVARRSVRARSSQIRARVLGKVMEVSITYVDPSRLRGRSAALVVRP